MKIFFKIMLLCFSSYVLSMYYDDSDDELKALYINTYNDDKIVADEEASDPDAESNDSEQENKVSKKRINNVDDEPRAKRPCFTKTYSADISADTTVVKPQPLANINGLSAVLGNLNIPNNK